MQAAVASRHIEKPDHLVWPATDSWAIHNHETSEPSDADRARKLGGMWATMCIENMYVIILVSSY